MSAALYPIYLLYVLCFLKAAQILFRAITIIEAPAPVNRQNGSFYGLMMVPGDMVGRDVYADSYRRRGQLGLIRRRLP
jgi:hypothetical protein